MSAKKSASEAGHDKAGDQSSSRLRLRAAWMYFIEGMTQSEIAERLGLGRVTVLRMIAAARENNEVKINIDHNLTNCVQLERELEEKFGIGEVIVVPLSDPNADAVVPIGAAIGQHISSLVMPDMKIGVGWGRTLLQSLAHIQRSNIANLSVVSLLGGIMKAKEFNPAEFAWRFADNFNADCFLMTAPALVDSAETRHRLIDNCGLKELFDIAQTLDVVLLSVGATVDDATYRRIEQISGQEQAQAREAGAVGDLMLHFYGAEGELTPSPLNDRVMSIPPQTLKKAKRRILASGGMNKVDALLGGIRLIEPTTFITDEWAARSLLEK
ncbi:sugar-binding transcriptional regulator [Rhodobacteraceae bacterium RKSG542]|uniref:sugar-binding transcriptional regulator n=1 Tax=Pseudovibrio flavus TaxID=2529854 RepID=UPI0012BBC03E|nr:sugar-binding transcriptional regulator [Pseudovibrio flavus]MTI18052.1 sugar-binding transcriptional regulator [Pseudovibrio flavus]